MRLFRASYTTSSGQKRIVKKWWIETRDHLQIVRRFAGFTDRKQTERLGEKIEKLVVHRSNNEPPDRALSEWIEHLPAKLRVRLVRVDLLTPDRATIGKALSENINDYRESLAAKNCSQHYIETTINAIKRIAADCRFNYWTDISAVKVEAYLKRLRDGGISYRRSNAYLTAIKMFANWMMQAGRASESPIRYLNGLNVRTDVRHSRRALLVDELRRLFETTAAGPERFGMTGQERALLYRLAVETGLRRNELKTLTVGCFDFDNLTVTVKAGYSKHRREDVLPLRENTAAELKQFLIDKLPAATVFGGSYTQLTDRTAEMIQADLQDAGIAYKDESGRVFDFHSLRHQTGSLLAASGVHPKVAQSIMRHSTIELTMGIYTHTLTGQDSQAVASLPDLSLPSSQQQRAVATGTDDFSVSENLAENLAFQGVLGRTIVDDGGQGDSAGAIKNAVSTGPARIRTLDQWIMSPLLYR